MSNGPSTGQCIVVEMGFMHINRFTLIISLFSLFLFSFFSYFFNIQYFVVIKLSSFCA